MTDRPTATDLARYARSFEAFAYALVIGSAHGPARFGDVWADFQVEAFKALAPRLFDVRGVEPGGRPVELLKKPARIGAEKLTPTVLPATRVARVSRNQADSTRNLR